MSQPHHFSVDVEEYFHPTALQGLIPQSSWDGLPRRSRALVPRILALLDEAGARCTFFTLGWLAEREPDVVRAISRAGHEIACHGWDHQKLDTLDPGAFSEDLQRSRGLLEDIRKRFL